MPKVVKTVAPTSAASLLQLMWLASPALPVGGFSYSEGLEAAVASGFVTDERTATQWLLDQLWLGLARSDMPVMSSAFMAWRRHDLERIGALNKWVTETRETTELRLQSEQMGRSMALWMKNRHHEATRPDERVARLAALQPAPTWPVAFALAAEQTAAPLRDAMLSFAFSWAENMAQSAIKCVPLGQLSGQRILEALTRDIPDAVTHAIDLPDSGRQAFTPMLAILSSRHETQYSRLFRS
jgi:urease accessory protein